MNKSLTQKIIIIIIILVICSSITVQAQDDTNSYPMLNLTAGKIGLFDDAPKKANRYGIEYRAKPIIVSKWDIELIPAYGYTWAVNESKFAYVDLKNDFHFKKNWVFTLSLGLGLFDNNDNIDLGHAIEFRSGFEIAYKFDQGYRLGLATYHLSNSRIASKNPGTESLVLSFLIPLNKIFGK